MSIREAIARKSGVVTIAAAALVVAAGAAIWLQASGPSVTHPRAYFTDDDGKTYFEGSETDLPPINHNGKQALRAYVYETPDGKRFVAYVERITPDARPIITRMSHWKPGDPQMTNDEQTAVANGHEYRKVGDPNAKWINGSDRVSMTYLQHVTTSDGKSAVPVD